MKNISRIAILVVVAFTSSCGVQAVNSDSTKVSTYTNNNTKIISVSSVKSNASISFNISANSFKAKATSNSPNPPKTVNDISYYEVYLLKNSASTYPTTGDPVGDTVVGGGTAFKIAQTGSTQSVTFNNLPSSGNDYYYVAVRAYDSSNNELIKMNNSTDTWSGSSLGSNRIAVTADPGVQVDSDFQIQNNSNSLSVVLNLEDGLGARIDASFNLIPDTSSSPSPQPSNYASGTLDIIAGNATGTTPSTVSQMATNTKLSLPSGVTVDNSGNVYIADNAANSSIEKISTDGSLKVIAGGGALVPDISGTQDATNVTLSQPFTTAVDNSGNIYIADRNHHTISKVDVSGKIKVIAGNGTKLPVPTTTPASAITVGLDDPTGVAVDNLGNVYISDYGTTGNYIEKIDTNGMIKIIAGNGSATPNSSGTQDALTDVKFVRPSQVAVDSIGNLYVADSGNGLIEKIDTATNKITVIAGGGGATATVATQPALSVNLINAFSLSVDSTGNVYVADYTHSLVEKIDTSGNISVVAGGGSTTPTITDPKSATNVKLNQPTGVAVDSSGALYIADYSNNYVEIVTP